MRPSRLLPIVAILAVAACADLNDVLDLSAAIQKEYHVAPTVALNNGTRLRVTFPKASIERLKMDSAARATFAHDVAVFAKAHYPKAAKLEDITVGFVAVTQTGPLTVTRTDPPYSFRARDLP